MRNTALFLCATVLAGCASIESSTPRSVVIHGGSAMGGKAMRLAEEECQKYGRHARYADKPSPNEFAYDCVE